MQLLGSLGVLFGLSQCLNLGITGDLQDLLAVALGWLLQDTARAPSLLAPNPTQSASTSQKSACLAVQ